MCELFKVLNIKNKVKIFVIGMSAANVKGRHANNVQEVVSRRSIFNLRRCEL